MFGGDSNGDIVSSLANLGLPAEQVNMLRSMDPITRNAMIQNMFGQLGAVGPSQGSPPSSMRGSAPHGQHLATAMQSMVNSSQGTPRHLTNRMVIEQQIMKIQQVNSPLFPAKMFVSQPEGSASSISTSQLTKQTVSAYKDLKLGQVNLGKVLLVRNILPPCKVVALQIAAQDTKGALNRIALYNFSKHLSIGAILAIKDPYLKNSADGYTSIRVENPKNVMVWVSSEQLRRSAFPFDSVKWPDIPELVQLAPDHAKTLLANTPTASLLTAQSVDGISVLDRPSVAEFRERGKAAFKAGNFEAAASVYQEAVCAYPKDSVLLNNLSLCYQKVGDWPYARFQAKRAVDADPDNVKAGYSLIKCLRMEGRLQDMLAAAEQQLKRGELMEAVRMEVMGWKNEAHVRVEECAGGHYRLSELQATFAKGEPLVYPDYIGPIKIQEVDHKGRGVVLTKNVKVGTVLLAEKALACSSASDTEVRISIDFADKTVYDPADCSLADKVISRAEWDDEFKAKVAELDPGGGRKRSINFDPKKIFYAVSNNSVGGSGAQLKKDKSMLFYQLSFLNHSCVPNAAPLFVGDFVVVTAMRNILKGEELVWDYRSAETDIEEKKQKLKKGWGFECFCQHESCK